MSLQAEMNLKAPEGQPGGMMGPGITGMMGGAQMGQMMPMVEIMQASTQTLKQMSATLGQHSTPINIPLSQTRSSGRSASRARR